MEGKLMARKQRKINDRKAKANNLLTRDEFCEATNMSRAKEDRLRRVEKVLPYYKIGARIFYGPQHVEQFLQSCEQRPAA
jgi:hypothetical protein